MKKQTDPLNTPLVWRKSLAAKFISLTVMVVITLGSVVAYINFKSQEKTITDNLNTQIAMLGNFLASIAPQSLLADDHEVLSSYMGEIGNNQDILYAAIDNDALYKIWRLRKHDSVVNRNFSL